MQSSCSLWRTRSEHDDPALRPWYVAVVRDDATDAELVVTIHGGGSNGRHAELLLCRRFSQRVFMYGVRHLRSDDRARDLSQAVLSAVIEAARGGRIETPEQLARFVLGTARNTMLRMREVDGRAQLVSHDVLDALAVEPAPSLDRVALAALMRCTSKLDERASAIVRMSFHEERSAEQIGQALQMSAGNVRVARHRALSALRQCLDAGEVGP